MTRILFIFVVKPLSLLPLRVLYLLSDIMFFVIYQVIGYRKSVVNANLRNSFPEKTDEEIKSIEKEFFKHLCDLIVEDVKLFSISKAELMARFRMKNTTLLQHYFDKGKSVILVGGHYNNWEVAAKAFNLYSPHQSIGIYAPLRNKYFERIFNASRSEFGVEVIAKSEVPRSFIANKDRLTMTIFGADQSPTYSKQVHWTTFLNQDTAVHVGTELFSVKYNYPVVFIHIYKVQRGYYEGVLELIHDNPANTKTGEISRLHTKMLEKDIISAPQFWLWSHKRWKRNKTEDDRLAEATKG